MNYFASNYWKSNYWAANYWAGVGGPVVPPIAINIDGGAVRWIRDGRRKRREREAEERRRRRREEESAVLALIGSLRARDGNGD